MILGFLYNSKLKIEAIKLNRKEKRLERERYVPEKILNFLAATIVYIVCLSIIFYSYHFLPFLPNAVIRTFYNSTYDIFYNCVQCKTYYSCWKSQGRG